MAVVQLPEHASLNLENRVFEKKAFNENIEEKQTYGFLGELTRTQWKEKLYSNEGIFAQLPKIQNVVGPNIIAGKLYGSVCAIEISYFTKHATSEQADFFCELLDTYIPGAKEYVLVMTGAMPKWRNSIETVQKGLSQVRMKKEIFHQTSYIQLELPLDKAACVPVNYSVQKDECIKSRKTIYEPMANWGSIQKMQLMRLDEDEKVLNQLLDGLKSEWSFLFENK